MALIVLNKQEKKDLLVLLKSSDNECYDNIIKKLKKKPIWKRVLYVIDGRFGNRVLKPKYRKWWRLFIYLWHIGYPIYKVCNVPDIRLVERCSRFSELCNLGLI